MNQPTDKHREEAREGDHVADCIWKRTTHVECEYRNTHHYCPHPEHACTCPPKVPDVAPKRLYVQLTPLGGTISRVQDPHNGKPVYEYVPASALSSRDVEVREVLEGLITCALDEGDGPVLHWCPTSEDSASDCTPACLATQRLWKRVRGTVNEEESDVVK